MKALWLERGVLRLVDAPTPEVDEGDALIKVLKAGICGTDAALVAGMYAFTGIPGHEFVGTVEAGPKAMIGRRVVGEINVVCGRCKMCASGWSKHCSRRTALGIRGRDGAFAEYLTLPLRNLHPVPSEVSDEAAVFTEPVAAALDVLEHINLETIERTLVVGDGKLAQLVCRVLARAGARVEVIGRHPRKLERLEGVAGKIYRQQTVPRRHYDLAVECSGNPSGLATALDALLPRGTLVLKSTLSSAARADTARLVVDELRLVGSRCGPFPRALELLASGELDVQALVDDRYPLQQGVEAFERSRQPGVLKVLLNAGP